MSPWCTLENYTSRSNSPLTFCKIPSLSEFPSQPSWSNISKVSRWVTPLLKLYILSILTHIFNINVKLSGNVLRTQLVVLSWFMLCWNKIIHLAPDGFRVVCRNFRWLQRISGRIEKKRERKRESQSDRQTSVSKKKKMGSSISRFFSIHSLIW